MARRTERDLELEVLPQMNTTQDLLEWLGFDSWDDYLKALPRERARIFERAGRSPGLEK